MENKMNIQEKIKDWIEETLKIEESFVLAHPKDIKNGDYSFFASPKLANEFGRALSENKIPEIEKVEVVGSFINFYLSKKFFTESIKEILEKGVECGQTDLLDGQKIIIEHTQPNPFKEFHIGRLMNNAIGESVARIIKANGADVKTASYRGAKGFHVAKAVWAMNKGIEYEKAYAYGNKAYEEDENTKQEIIALNKTIYDGKITEIWKICNDGFNKFKNYFLTICRRLDTTFDYQFWETASGEVGKKIVLENVGKIFENGEGGAVIFKGENFEPKTHTRVFINSEGLPTYEAKEVGLAKIKKELFAYNKSITVTGNEQDSFFDVTEIAIGEVLPELKGKLKHLSHGMLRLPTGKMSSRTGDVITTESLIDQVKEKVREKIAERNLSEEEKEEILEVVAIGAIKYSILRQAIGGDIIFDFDKSISFEGDSGPYLQYACVRANSILEKADMSRLNLDMSEAVFDTWETTELEKYLYRFTEVVERAGTHSTGSINSLQAGSGQVEYAPHHIVTYLTELASIFNSFYAKEKIIDPSDGASPYKIALTQAVAYTLKSGLRLLGIKVPDKM